MADEQPAQPDDHKFKKGHKRLPGAGRRKGSRNKLSLAMKDAVLMAAEIVGEKQQHSETHEYTEPGPDGLLGYMVYLARFNETAYTSLLRAVLPMHVNIAAVQNRRYRTEEEVRALCLARGVDFDEIAGLAEQHQVDAVLVAVAAAAISSASRTCSVS